MPQNVGLQDLFVMGMTSPFLDSDDQEELWTKFELPYRPEVMINFGANLLMSIANKEPVARSLKRYKFIVSIDLFDTETLELRRHRAAGLRLPAVARFALELSVHLQPAGRAWASGAGRSASRCCRPRASSAASQDVLLELADRVGFRADMNAAFNASLNLRRRVSADTATALQLGGDLRSPS